jgi:hypothetical protein
MFPLQWDILLSSQKYWLNGCYSVEISKTAHELWSNFFSRRIWRRANRPTSSECLWRWSILSHYRFFVDQGGPERKWITPLRREARSSISTQRRSSKIRDTPRNDPLAALRTIADMLSISLQLWALIFSRIGYQPKALWWIQKRGRNLFLALNFGSVSHLASSSRRVKKSVRRLFLCESQMKSLHFLITYGNNSRHSWSHIWASLPWNLDRIERLFGYFVENRLYG